MTTRSASLSWNSRYGPAVLVLAALVALTFGRSVTGAFVWDDVELIQNNNFIRHPDPGALVSPRYFIATGENGYRPLVTVAHLVNAAVLGVRPWSFRLVNLLLHLTCVACVYAFARRRFGADAALWGAALYAVHPLQAEAVSVSALRADLLCVPLVLASLELLARPGRIAWLGVLAYAFGLLAKEEALVVPALWLLDRWWRGERRWRPELAAGLALVTVLYLPVRFVWMRNPTLPEAAALGHDPASWISAWLWLLGQIARVVALPIRLCAAYERPASWWPEAWLGVLALMVAALVAWRGGRAWRYGIAWFFVALLPVAGIASLPKPLAERFLTLPLVGLAFALGVVAARPRLLPRLLIAAVAVAWTMRAHARTEEWRSDAAIWAATVRDCPPSARALLNLAATLGNAGREVEAVVYLERALKIEPGNATAHLNLGLSYQALDRLDRARVEIGHAVRLQPQWAIAHTALASVLLQSGETEAGEKELETALRLDPYDARTRRLKEEIERLRPKRTP